MWFTDPLTDVIVLPLSKVIEFLSISLILVRYSPPTTWFLGENISALRFPDLLVF